MHGMYFILRFFMQNLTPGVPLATGPAQFNPNNKTKQNWLHDSMLQTNYHMNACVILLQNKVMWKKGLPCLAVLTGLQSFLKGPKDMFIGCFSISKTLIITI